MLALQRHSMGSAKPSTLPFGYESFDPSSEFSFPPPPVPAPGPSILDDTESKFLHNFFDDVSSDQFNGSDYFDKTLSMGGGYDLPFGWMELPVGNSTSFGLAQHGQQSSHAPVDIGLGLMGNDTSSISSAEVLAAAGTLMGGHNHGSENVGLGTDFFAAHDISRTLQTGPSLTNQPRTPLHSNSMTPFPTSRNIPAPATSSRKDDFSHSPFYTGIGYGSTNPPARSSKPEDIQWGSDSGFGALSFIAPPGQESQKRLERDMLKQLDCFAPKLEVPQSFQACSSTSTTPSSPTTSRAQDGANNTRRPSAQLMSATHREEDGVNKKRQKSTNVKIEEDENASSYENTPKPNPLSRKRKQPTPKSNSTNDGLSQPSPSTSCTKRRKSTNNNNNNTNNNSSNGNCSDTTKSKSTRENLTEDQKRENHIKSEQKRRTLIKEGFDDLGELVPELASGGFSKSAVLLMAGDWLEDLVGGNEALRRQLAVLEGRG